MKESAQAALTLVKGQATVLGLENGIFQDSDIPIHVTAEAKPKDGPSAGVSIYQVLESLLLQHLIHLSVNEIDRLKRQLHLAPAMPG